MGLHSTVSKAQRFNSSGKLNSSHCCWLQVSANSKNNPQLLMNNILRYFWPRVRHPKWRVVDIFARNIPPCKQLVPDERLITECKAIAKVASPNVVDWTRVGADSEPPTPAADSLPPTIQTNDLHHSLEEPQLS